MSCDNCLATAIRAKLGRCPVCAIQTFVIGLSGWLVWWWCGADTSALGGSGLLLLHLLVFVWRRATGRELSDE